MTIDEYSKKYNLTYKQVYDRIKKGDIHAVKRGKEYQLEDIPPPLVEDSSRNLKDQLVLMQIRKIEQHLESGKNHIRKEYEGEVIRTVMESLNELHNDLDKILTEDQKAGWNDSIHKCIVQLKEYSETLL